MGIPVGESNPAPSGNPATAPIVGYAGEASQSIQQHWLDVAWRALLLEVPDIPDRIASGELDPAAVADVVTAAALRVLRNPEGNESESGAIDDYQESWKRADSSMDVYFTTAEIRRLSPVGSSDAGGWSGSMKYAY